jgi:hypothetical protein
MTEFFVGQQLTLNELYRGRPATDQYYGPIRTLPEGTVVTVTRVNVNTIWIRGYYSTMNEATLSISTDPEVIQKYFGELDPNTPRPRRLGETPEGMIDPNDPRIAWIFEDMGTIATREGYCGYYDTLADKVGFPGRIRDFTIKRDIGGFSVSRKYKAKSRKEAEALFDAELKEALV